MDKGGVYVDTGSRHKTAASSRRPVRRTKRLTKKSGARGDNRHLIQLVVSLALFLLVYIGRGVFPNYVAAWRNALTADVDFRAAFQEFGRAISEGERVDTAFQSLCVTVFGGEAETGRPQGITGGTSVPVPLSQTERSGLSYLSGHGVLVGTKTPQDKEPVQSLPPEETEAPETAPAIVTAVAQAYTDNGVALPSNVSLAYYELGLEKTAVPVKGVATSGFGYRDSPINGKQEFHLALDIGASVGTEIGAFADGVVEYIGKSDEFGLYLKIAHANNVSSFYAHCSKLLVSKGDQVSCGQTVALVGATGNVTGPHLHLTIEKDNIRLDPAYYVDLKA